MINDFQSFETTSIIVACKGEHLVCTLNGYFSTCQDGAACRAVANKSKHHCEPAVGHYASTETSTEMAPRGTQEQAVKCARG